MLVNVIVAAEGRAWKDATFATLELEVVPQRGAIVVLGSEDGRIICGRVIDLVVGHSRSPILLAEKLVLPQRSPLRAAIDAAVVLWAQEISGGAHKPLLRNEVGDQVFELETYHPDREERARCCDLVFRAGLGGDEVYASMCGFNVWFKLASDPDTTGNLVWTARVPGLEGVDHVVASGSSVFAAFDSALEVLKSWEGDWDEANA